MNAGFVALWIIIVVLVLLLTGWKSQLAPDVSRKSIIWLGVAALILFLVPIGLTLSLNGAQASIQASVLLFILAATAGIMTRPNAVQLMYLFSCILILSFLWGMLRKIYSLDPVFFLFDPIWDGPLICGMLAGILTTQTKEQFTVIVWSSVLAALLNAYLQGYGYIEMIGSLLWWDTFMIALAAARAVSLLLKGGRALSVRLGLLQ